MEKKIKKKYPYAKKNGLIIGAKILLEIGNVLLPMCVS